MKLYLTFFLTIVLHWQVFCQKKDEAEIKKVCLAETKAYNSFDFDKVAFYHVKGPTDQITWNNADGSYGHHLGWNDFAKGLKDWFATAKKVKPEQVTSNFQYYISGNLAMVSYSTASKNEQGKVTNTRDYKVLKRINGQWKILTTQTYTDFSTK